MSFFPSAAEMVSVYKTKVAEEVARQTAKDAELERLRAAYVPPTEEELRRLAEEAVAAVQKREEDRYAAYPAEFAAALTEYMDYLRPLVREAIQKTSGRAGWSDVAFPPTELTVGMGSYGVERGTGCCGLDGDPVHLRWEKTCTHNSFRAADFFDPYTCERLELVDPVIQLKGELEPLGYTVSHGSEGEGDFYVTIPLSSA